MKCSESPQCGLRGHIQDLTESSQCCEGMAVLIIHFILSHDTAVI